MCYHVYVVHARRDEALVTVLPWLRMFSSLRICQSWHTWINWHSRASQWNELCWLWVVLIMASFHLLTFTCMLLMLPFAYCALNKFILMTGCVPSTPYGSAVGRNTLAHTSSSSLYNQINIMFLMYAFENVWFEVWSLVFCMNVCTFQRVTCSWSMEVCIFESVQIWKANLLYKLCDTEQCRVQEWAHLVMNMLGSETFL